MIASFKDLCIDAVDVDVIGPFWAAALGRDVERQGDLLHLTGPTEQHGIWINPVPEPVTVKQRVHLDLHVASTDDVLALGAAPLDTTSFGWDVLRDPEGGELCTFPREQVPEERLYEIVVDSADPAGLGRWWAGVLGGRWEHDEEHGWSSIEEVPGTPFECFVFVPVPEPKTVKNRIHWDVDVADVRLLVEHGATVLREPDGDIRWTILADPEGNEFCAFTE